MLKNQDYKNIYKLIEFSDIYIVSLKLLKTFLTLWYQNKIINLICSNTVLFINFFMFSQLKTFLRYIKRNTFWCVFGCSNNLRN